MFNHRLKFVSALLSRWSSLWGGGGQCTSKTSKTETIILEKTRTNGKKNLPASKQCLNVVWAPFPLIFHCY
jgi:hypothetical protein